MGTPAQLQTNPRKIAEQTKNRWKFCWGLTFWLRFIGAVWFLIVAWKPEWFVAGREAILLALVGFVSNVTQYVGSAARVQAETLKQQFEFSEGLGTHIDTDLATSLYDKLSPSVKEKVIADPVKDRRYYESVLPKGPRRLVEMLLESSFYSRSHSGLLEKWVWKSLFALVLVVLGLLWYLSILPLTSTIPYAELTKAIASGLGILIGFNLLYLALDYKAFRDSCERFQSKANELLRTPEINVEDASRLLQAYQFERAFSPPLFSFVHRHRKDNVRDALLDYWAKNEERWPGSSKVTEIRKMDKVNLGTLPVSAADSDPATAQVGSTDQGPESTFQHDTEPLNDNGT